MDIPIIIILILLVVIGSQFKKIKVLADAMPPEEKKRMLIRMAIIVIALILFNLLAWRGIDKLWQVLFYDKILFCLFNFSAFVAFSLMMLREPTPGKTDDWKQNDTAKTTATWILRILAVAIIATGTIVFDKGDLDSNEYEGTKTAEKQTKRTERLLRGSPSLLQKIAQCQPTEFSTLEKVTGARKEYEEQGVLRWMDRSSCWAPKLEGEDVIVTFVEVDKNGWSEWVYFPTTPQGYSVSIDPENYKDKYEFRINEEEETADRIFPRGTEIEGAIESICIRGVTDKKIKLAIGFKKY